MTTELRTQVSDHQPRFVKVRTLWHNSFDDLLTTTPEELKAQVSFGAAALAGEVDVTGVDESRGRQDPCQHPPGTHTPRRRRVPARRWRRLAGQRTVRRQVDSCHRGLGAHCPRRRPGLTVVGPLQQELRESADRTTINGCAIKKRHQRPNPRWRPLLTLPSPTYRASCCWPRPGPSGCFSRVTPAATKSLTASGWLARCQHLPARCTWMF